MVVVAVSLVLTSIGTSRFAPQIPLPEEEHRRVGEACSYPPTPTPTPRRSKDIFRLAGRLTEPVGGVIQPLVVATSTDGEAVEKAHLHQARADEILKRVGQDVETELRIDRSIAAGLNRAAIQANSSMLLLAWPGPDNVRGWLLGADYSEIIAATALPVGVAALHDNPDAEQGRVVIVARRSDLVPGNQPSLRLGVEIARMLRRRDEELILGPLPPATLIEADIELPERIEHHEGPDDIADWVAENTQPGDLVILPLSDIKLRPSAIKIFESGRSVLAVTHNPESQSALNGSTMTLPVGGSIAPT